MAPKKMARTIPILLGVVVLAFAAAATLDVGEPLLRGYLLRHRILAALDAASSVRVVEHSDPSDCDWGPAHPYKEVIYRTVPLSPAQRSCLEDALPLSRDYSFLTQPGCFMPHHRIEFVDQSSHVRTLEICFHCNNLLRENNDGHMLPKRWEKSLRDFILSLDLHPSRDWPAEMTKALSSPMAK